MSDLEPFAEVNGATLVEAFPDDCRQAAERAVADVLPRLHHSYSTACFAVRVDGHLVSIPVRLYFASPHSALVRTDDARHLALALQTRSCDGHERQRALEELIPGAAPWAAPFIVALAGEYVVEILEVIHAGMTPELERALGGFVLHNETFWATTKRRVMSYWDAYYRSMGKEYVGFKLVRRLDEAALAYADDLRG